MAKKQIQNIFYNLNQKRLRRLLFSLTILSIPLFQIYYYGIILTDLFLFLTIIVLLSRTSIIGKNCYPVWHRKNSAFLFLLLYILLIGIGGFNYQKNYFFFEYIKHAYAPFYAIAVVFIGYALYGDNFLSKILKYIACIGLFVALINFAFLIINFTDIVQIFELSWMTGSGKLHFPLNTSSQLSGFLISTFPIVVVNYTWSKKSNQPRWVYLSLISYLFIVVALGTGSRTGFAVICMEIVAMCLLGFWLSPLKAKAFGFVVILLFICLGYSLSAFILEKKAAFVRSMSIFSYVLAGDSILIPAGREEIHNTLVILVEENPIFGAGLSACKSLVGQETHNIYFGSLAETGIGGMFLIISIFLLLPFVYLYKIFNIIGNKRLLILHYPLMAAVFGQSVYGISHYALRMRLLWLLSFIAFEAIFQLSHLQRQKS